MWQAAREGVVLAAEDLGGVVAPTHCMPFPGCGASMEAGRPAPLRLAQITTVPESLLFLQGQPRYMRRQGIEEAAISSPGPYLSAFGLAEAVPTFAVPMRRSISPVSDLLALVRLWVLLRKLRPDIVDAHTPKAALLGMVAARLAGVPVRIYHVHGLRFATCRGLRRRVLRSTERIASRLATRILHVSHSNAAAFLEERLGPPAKVTVLLHGSINGVDTSRFRPASDEVRTKARRALGIPPDAMVVGFVGRLGREKGLLELADAWRSLREEMGSLRLLLVGPPEPNDPIPDRVLAELRAHQRVHLFGFDRDTPKYFQAMDVLALPTYREGFPVVPLEAAASALPVVATRVPGCDEAVLDGVTGTLTEPRDTVGLTNALRAYLRDASLRRRHGTAGLERVLRDFQPEALWRALHDEYTRLHAEACSRMTSRGKESRVPATARRWER